MIAAGANGTRIAHHRPTANPSRSGIASRIRVVTTLLVPRPVASVAIPRNRSHDLKGRQGVGALRRLPSQTPTAMDAAVSGIVVKRTKRVVPKPPWSGQMTDSSGMRTASHSARQSPAMKPDTQPRTMSIAAGQAPADGEKSRLDKTINPPTKTATPPAFLMARAVLAFPACGSDSFSHHEARRGAWTSH